MMACHAMVQRILLEALGVVEVDPRTTAVAPVMSPPAALDMTPMFADDGYLAGRSYEVARALTHVKTILPMLGLRFSMLDAVPAAGGQHRIDKSTFETLGCTWVETGNLEVLKSPIGSPMWCAEYSSKRADRAVRAVQAVGALPAMHVAYNLLRVSASACQLTYLSRTTPPDFCGNALATFDRSQQAAFVRLTGLPITDQQWTQATCPTKHGGLGLRQATWGQMRRTWLQLQRRRKSQ
jgi:hypothetical protein